MPATFDFPYHIPVTVYPDNSSRVQFGGAYEFVSKPNAPDQRIFILSFAGMSFFFNTDGTINASTNAQYNYKALRNFYESVKLYDKFNYPHPEFGTILVRFHKPLQDPKLIPNGRGLTEPFEIELIEQP
jgi:hypothetical protein